MLISESYTKTGRYYEALDCYFEALKIQRNIFGTDESDTDYVLILIGKAFKDLENYEIAIDYFKESLNINKKQENKDISSLLFAIGELYEKIERFDEALLYYQELLDFLQKMYGKNDFNIIAITLNRIISVALHFSKI